MKILGPEKKWKNVLNLQNFNMKVGICFGGYCPLHQGHMDVIMRAKKENDKCLVIVCGYDNEPRGWEINLNLDERYTLIYDFFRKDEQIIVEKINDTELGLDESMSVHNWEVWLDKVKKYLISNSLYDAEHTFYVAEPFYKKSIESCISAPWVDNVILVDKVNPVSGTQIRKNPVKYWSKITAPFKPYLCKNILIIGTASEGKSTLVRDIANYFDIPYAQEYGREYMEADHITDKDLTYADFDAFLNGQLEECDIERRKSKNGIFISDTDNTVTLMYALAYVDDYDIYLSAEDYRCLYEKAKELNKIYEYKWDKIFIFPPSGKKFVDDGCRYMKQASIEERNKNFEKLQKLVAEFYPDVNKTYLNGTYLENFNEVKNYINSLIEG